MKRMIAIVMAATIVLQTGCATIIWGSKRKVTVSSQPSGADVIVNGEKKGTTPAKVKFPRKRNSEIKLEKKGYRDDYAVVGPTGANGSAIAVSMLASIPTMFISYYIDMATGSLYKMNNKLDVELSKLPQNVKGSLPIVCNEVNLKMSGGDKIGGVYRQKRNKRILVEPLYWGKSVDVNVYEYIVEANKEMEEAGYDVTVYGDEDQFGQKKPPSMYLKASIDNMDVQGIVIGTAMTASSQGRTEASYDVTYKLVKANAINDKEPLYERTFSATATRYGTESAVPAISAAFTSTLYKALNDPKLVKQLEMNEANVAEMKKIDEANNKPVDLLFPTPPAMNSKSDVYKFAKDAVATVKTEYGHGSGAVISSDGYILTNNHVVKGSPEVTVKFNNGNEVKGQVIKYGNKYDLALVKADTSGLKSLRFGNSSDLTPGVDVLAIGTPNREEFSQTMTSGIISGMRKSDETDLSYIQTDVSISPGNSGGPLLNSKGEIIGVITLKVVGRGVEGIGFAIPSDEVFPDLRLQYK